MSSKVKHPNTGEKLIRIWNVRIFYFIPSTNENITTIISTNGVSSQKIVEIGHQIQYIGKRV